MSDESEDYDSDSNDYIDKLVDAYRNMQNMFDEKPFAGYDATFDAYDANNANLDAAVAAWFAAPLHSRPHPRRRMRDGLQAPESTQARFWSPARRARPPRPPADGLERSDDQGESHCPCATATPRPSSLSITHRKRASVLQVFG